MCVEYCCGPHSGVLRRCVVDAHDTVCLCLRMRRHVRESVSGCVYVHVHKLRLGCLRGALPVGFCDTSAL